MYFNSEAQGRILSRFHFALNEGGFLFLGRAETLMAHGQTFSRWTSSAGSRRRCLAAARIERPPQPGMATAEAEKAGVSCPMWVSR